MHEPRYTVISPGYKIPGYFSELSSVKYTAQFKNFTTARMHWDGTPPNPSTIDVMVGSISPGGHLPRKGVWGCAAVMTPFFQATRRSLAYQFTIIAPLLCPPFSNFRKKFNFQPCFGQNFSSQDANFPNFRSLDPSFFKENPLPRPYFWKPVWHTPTKKKSWVPPREYIQTICANSFLVRILLKG